MTDDSTDQEQPATGDSTQAGGSRGSLREALSRRDAHGRPMGVYAVLAAGVVTLVGLMLVVYFWSSDRDRQEQPICTTIAVDHAREAILDGNVERFTLVYSSEAEAPESDGWGPVQARLDYADGQCGYLPQGVEHQPELFAILGAITFYNQTTESAQIELEYSGLANLDPVLFTTPTVEPTETTPATPEATATPTVTPSPEPTGTAASPPATPEATAAIGSTPGASPSPAVSPPATP
jgi:hypothetical protein